MNNISNGSSVISNLPNLENQAINTENQNPQQINAPQNAQTGKVGIDTGLQALQRAETANKGLRGIEGQNNIQPAVIPQNAQPVQTTNRQIISGNISLGLNEIENGAVQNQPANGPADLPAQEAYNKLSLINDIITQLQPTDPSLLFIVKNFFSNLINLLCGHNWQGNDEALIREKTAKFLTGNGNNIVLDTAEKFLKCTNINDKIRIAGELAYIAPNDTIKNAALAFLTTHNDDNFRQALTDYQNRQTPDYGRLLFELRTCEGFLGNNMVKELGDAFIKKLNSENQKANPATIALLANVIGDELSKAAIGWAQKHFDIDPQCHDIRNVLVFCPHEELLGKYPGFNGLTFGQKISVLEQVIADLNDHNDYLCSRHQFDKDDNAIYTEGKVLSREMMARNVKDFYHTVPLTEDQKNKNKALIADLRNIADNYPKKAMDFQDLVVPLRTLADSMEQFSKIPDDKFEKEALAASFQVQEAQNKVSTQIFDMINRKKIRNRDSDLSPSQHAQLDVLEKYLNETRNKLDKFTFGDRKVNIDYFNDFLERQLNDPRLKETYPQVDKLLNSVVEYRDLVKRDPGSPDIPTIKDQIYLSMHNIMRHLDDADKKSFEEHFEVKIRIILGEDPAFVYLKEKVLNRQEELNRQADFAVQRTLEAINFDTDKSLQSFKGQKSPDAINLLANMMHNCPSAAELTKCLAPLKDMSETELNDFMNNQIGDIVKNLGDDGISRLLHFLYSGRYYGIESSLNSILGPVDSEFNRIKEQKKDLEDNIAQNGARLNQATKDNDIKIHREMKNIEYMKELRKEGKISDPKIDIQNNRNSIADTLKQQSEERKKFDEESLHNSLKTDNEFALAKAKYDQLKDLRLVHNVLTKMQEIIFKQAPQRNIPTNGFIPAQVSILTSEAKKEFTSIKF